MKNRNEPEVNRVRPVNPFDQVSRWDKAVLTCARCKTVLVKFPIDLTPDEQVGVAYRVKPIIERAVHMHVCVEWNGQINMTF